MNRKRKYVKYSKIMSYIEKDLPIEELGKLAHREAHARSPIYQMHKWWARRSSSVFRMFILASFADDDIAKSQLWEQFYNEVDLKGKIVLDPFMGGGTTIVEALRLGCKVAREKSVVGRQGDDINSCFLESRTLPFPWKYSMDTSWETQHPVPQRRRSS